MKTIIRVLSVSWNSGKVLANKVRFGWTICQNCGIGYDPTYGVHKCPESKHIA